MIFVIVVFVLALICITLLFGLKYWELQNGHTIVPEMRHELDVRALQFKELLAALRVDIEKLPPEALRLGRILIHEAALQFASAARFAEAQAHRLADFVSHKHRFERRETRSEFLKKVAEHRNGNGWGRSEAGSAASEPNESAE